MHHPGQRGAGAPQDQADKNEFAYAAAFGVNRAGDLKEEVAEEEQRPQQGGDTFGDPQIFSNTGTAEAKLKLARSRYARLYVINTIGMMYHQRFVAFVELFIGLPL